MCVRTCVRVCVCVCACVRERARVCVCACVCTFSRMYKNQHIVCLYACTWLVRNDGLTTECETITKNKNH